MEQHHYNSYSSTTHSNSKQKLYLALNNQGQPRKVQIPVTRTLGKLATYTKSLTETVAHERIEALITRIFGQNYAKHGLKQLCDSGRALVELTSKVMKPKPKCSKKNNKGGANLNNNNNNNNNNIFVIIYIIYLYYYLYYYYIIIYIIIILSL